MKSLVLFDGSAMKWSGSEALSILESDPPVPVLEGDAMVCSWTVDGKDDVVSRDHTIALWMRRTDPGVHRRRNDDMVAYMDG